MSFELTLKTLSVGGWLQIAEFQAAGPAYICAENWFSVGQTTGWTKPSSRAVMLRDPACSPHISVYGFDASLSTCENITLTTAVLSSKYDVWYFVNATRRSPDRSTARFVRAINNRLIINIDSTVSVIPLGHRDVVSPCTAIPPGLPPPHASMTPGSRVVHH